MEHTETPWIVINGNVYRARDKAPIAHMDRTEEASQAKIYPVERDTNAHFIVLACNAHNELVEALKAINKGLADGSIKFTKKRVSDADPYHPANVKMCAVIAKIKGRK